jgi:hypothetical protein
MCMRMCICVYVCVCVQQTGVVNKDPMPGQELDALPPDILELYSIHPPVLSALHTLV